MKTLSLLFCAFLVATGLFGCIIEHNLAGIVLVVVGSLSFLIISAKTKKIVGYNPKSFMNR